MNKFGVSSILFQGDSITDGNRGRNDDLNHILGHGYVFLLAAELGLQAAGQAPHMVNRGCSGNRIADLYGRWEEDALSLHPDLISLLIGVNDVHAFVNGKQDLVQDRFVRTYRRLIEDTQELLASTAIVICEPFLLPAGQVGQAWQAWHSEMSRKQEQIRKIADEYDLDYIDLQQSFIDACELAPAAYWLWDGIHPTPAGHALIKNRWMDFYSKRFMSDSGISVGGQAYE
ncbi:SGNH/GDSL hydrolase family protein [Paenibacillus sp. Soil724D2]|uniref:SGNH/GDSL hydrolase family protein n=1 Tax=Paenibacillus sp. (strain Soil724D2) TaxID=1736392 RepID=UPI0007C85F1A|nr:SGNH/GDSL hydrolase family protein [Paenibacillus sp. Soil724D2]